MIVYKKVHKGCQKGTAAEIILSAQSLSFGLSIKYTTEHRKISTPKAEFFVKNQGKNFLKNYSKK